MLKKSPILFALAVLVLAVGWPITPAQAHCKGPHTGNHPHCLDPGSTYDVTMTGDLSFIDPPLYVGTDGGGRSKPVNVGFQVIKIDMSFFDDKFGLGRGEKCFAEAPVEGMNTIAITISQEKDLSASLRYWFTAHGDDGTVINYLLEMFDGFFVPFDGWRPAPTNSTTTTFTSWEMSMNSGGKKKIACTGTGNFSSGVQVTVLNTTP